MSGVTPRVRRAVPALLVASIAALAAVLASGCTARSEGSARLEASGPAWVLAGSPVELRVVARGALAQRRVSIVVAANANVIGSFDTGATGEARVSVPARALRAGRNRFAIKTGSERTSLQIVVVPVLWPAAAMLLAGAGVAALLMRRRRRR